MLAAPSTSTEASPKKSKLRSSQPVFQWKTNCFFCNEIVKFDAKHPGRCQSSRRVNGKDKSVLMKQSILDRCAERNDSLGSIVHTRLGNVRDLVAEEAVYHTNCHVQFYNDVRQDEG